MNNLKTYFFFFLILFLNNNLLAKSPPPGTGTADVPANILIMLDNSGSMAWDINGRERFANQAKIQRPIDVKRYGDQIYVLNHNTRRIVVLDQNGNYQKDLFTGSRYSCNGINYGYGFDVYDDYIYFLDSYSRQIKIINKNNGSCSGTISTIERTSTYNRAITVNENYIFVPKYHL